jgi:NAD-dependent SIR2 family protein deacetylase
MFCPCEVLHRVSGYAPRRKRSKRVVLLVGAGASIEYKAPSTSALTNAIEGASMGDALMKHTGADAAFAKIKSGLRGYLNTPPNFEQIYHCAHELLSLEGPTRGAFDAFRPLLFPFITDSTSIPKDALRALIDKIAEVIFTEVARACTSNPLSLAPLTKFITALRAIYITRIYTTNYDDFLLQAAPDLFIGFDRAPSAHPKRFQLDGFWASRDLHSLFYLHGSVHMGFRHPGAGGGDIGELFWFDDRAEALRHAAFHGGGVRQMDGTSFSRTAVITGLDKLSRLQQRLLSHFYSALGDDLMRADVIVVIGSSLADLHLNTWLREARCRSPQPPILFVDHWKDGFLDTLFDAEQKEIEMFHALGIHIRDYGDALSLGNGWVVAKDLSAAVWEKGFQAFLNEPAKLEQVLGKLELRRLGGGRNGRPR